MTGKSLEYIRNLFPAAKIVEDVGSREFEMSELEFISVMGDERRMRGTEMKTLAIRERACFGLSDGLRMREFSHLLPHDLGNRLILLLGTVISSPTGKRHYFPFLWTINGKWEIDWGPLDKDWKDDLCLVPRVKVPIG